MTDTPTTPKGRRGTPAPEQGADQTIPAASADDAGPKPGAGQGSTDEAHGGAGPGNEAPAVGHTLAAPTAAPPADQAPAGVPSADEQQDEVEPARPAANDILAQSDLPKLTIRDFARDRDGAVARDERGRAAVEERPLRPDDIISHREGEDSDVVHLILRDGRKLRVRAR